MWFNQRISLLPGAVVANASIEAAFSVERVWHDSPMGYHLGADGNLPAGVWDDESQRKKIYEYW